MKDAYKVLMIAVIGVIFFVGLMQRLDVPLTLGPGGSGPIKIKVADAHEREVVAQEVNAKQTVRTLVQDGALTCATHDESALERIIERQNEKELEDARRKDSGETRKQYIQLGLTIFLLPVSTFMFIKYPKLRTPATAILTAVLAFWLKA
jgi:hypothetical protein